MEPWILHAIRKSWRRMSGCQFVTSSSSALGLCSRTMIPNTPASPPLNGSRKTKVLEWPSQSLDLNPIEMLWHDLKLSFHAWKPSSVAELKQFCKEEWAKILPQRCEDSLPVIANAWLQLLLQRVAQPVIRFRGQLLFHIVPGRFGQLFSLNKWNHYFKTAFWIYSGYLCVILTFVWWSESFKCDKYAKDKKNRKGQKPFHGTVYKLAGLQLLKEIWCWQRWYCWTFHEISP